MKKSRIYTCKGDQGTTNLIGGKRVLKTDLRVEAYGTIDELNANIGVLVSFVTQEDVKDRLRAIQNDLFSIGAYLAAVHEVEDDCIIIEEDVRRIERYIDDTENGLLPLKGFVIPGGSSMSAVCHVCRTVCRRAERRIIELSTKEVVAPIICAYINRLSDYFFVLSRGLLHSEGKDEIIWKKRC